MLAQMLGETKWGLDYAFSPVHTLGAPSAMPTSSGDAVGDSRAAGGEASAAAAGKGSAGPLAGLHPRANLSLLQVCWAPDGATPDILVGCGQTHVTVLRQGSGETQNTVHMTRLHFESGGRELILCQEALRVLVASSEPLLACDVELPPVQLLWAARPVKAILDAAESAGEGFSEGIAVSGKVLPLTNAIGVSTQLRKWYILEQAQSLGGEYAAKVHAELEKLGFGAQGRPELGGPAASPRQAGPPGDSADGVGSEPSELAQQLGGASRQDMKFSISFSALTLAIEADGQSAATAGATSVASRAVGRA